MTNLHRQLAILVDIEIVQYILEQNIINLKYVLCILLTYKP